ncbi:hypothetical protein GCM10027343_02610 [Noviherbaspirillum agri]
MKIFLVEDSEVILGHLRGVVAEMAGAEVLAEANSEDAAIAGIAALRPDVAILDLTLASGSGIEVLRQVKQRQPDVKVVVLTNRSEEPYRRKCMGLGADLFLDKSRDFERLKQCLVTLGVAGPATAHC